LPARSGTVRPGDALDLLGPDNELYSATVREGDPPAVDLRGGGVERLGRAVLVTDRVLAQSHERGVPLVVCYLSWGF